MATKIELRRLINMLEQLSMNGRNDHMCVEVHNKGEQDYFASHVGNVSVAYIDTFQTPNDEYDFIRIDIV